MNIHHLIHYKKLPIEIVEENGIWKASIIIINREDDYKITLKGCSDCLVALSQAKGYIDKIIQFPADKGA